MSLARQCVRASVSLSLMLAAVSNAETVGRTSFDLPRDGWNLVVAYEHKLSFNGGEHSIPLFTKLYQLPGRNGEPRALLELTSTDGGNRNKVNWVSESCGAARSKFFTENFGSNTVTRQRECLVVNPAFKPTAFFKEGSPEAKAMHELGLQFFKSGYSIRSVVGLQGGTLLRVNLMTQRDFRGMEDRSPQASELHDVSPTLVAWGEALHGSVSESVHSMSGRLVLPPVEFTEK